MSGLEGLEERVTALEEDRKRSSATHKEFYERLRNLEIASNESKLMLQELKEIKEDVRELKEKPARRWESAVNIVLQALILAALAALQLSR